MDAVRKKITPPCCNKSSDTAPVSLHNNDAAELVAERGGLVAAPLLCSALRVEEPGLCFACRGTPVYLIAYLPQDAARATFLASQMGLLPNFRRSAGCRVFCRLLRVVVDPESLTVPIGRE